MPIFYVRKLRHREISVLPQTAEFIVQEVEFQPPGSGSLATLYLTCLMAPITASIIPGTPKDRGS